MPPVGVFVGNYWRVLISVVGKKRITFRIPRASRDIPQRHLGVYSATQREFSELSYTLAACTMRFRRGINVT